MTNFAVWLEESENDVDIKTQIMRTIGSTNDMSVLGQVSISAVHSHLMDALTSGGWFKQHVPQDRLQQTIGWLALNKNSDKKILDLVKFLSGQQPFDLSKPASSKAPPVKDVGGPVAREKPNVPQSPLQSSETLGQNQAPPQG